MGNSVRVGLSVLALAGVVLTGPSAYAQTPQAAPPGQPQQPQQQQPQQQQPQQQQYPQQQYPQQQYPQQQYPQQQYPQQQYPQQQYPQQPAYAPAAPDRRGFAAALYMGFHNYTGDYGNGLDAGLRLGTVLSARISDTFSIGGGLDIDVLNVEGVPAGADATGALVIISVVPTFHFPMGNKGEFVLSPKLGVMGSSITISSGIDDLTVTTSGYAVGVNAGMAFPVGNLLLGPMLMLEHQTMSETCFEDGSGEVCSDAEGDASSGTVVSLLFTIWL